MSKSDEINNQIRTKLAQTKEQLVAHYASGGREQIEILADELHKPPALFVYLFDEAGQSRIERDVPTNFLNYRSVVMARDNIPGVDAIESLWSGQNRLIVSGLRLEAANQEIVYAIVGAIQFKDAGELSDRNILILRFIVSFIFVGLICFVLSRHLTKPLKILQSAVRNFAAGTLETRVNQSLSKRKDEIGELGREFDAMAERINSLVAGEKRMLRDISHELRSPLARMHVAVELARKKTDGSDSDELNRIELETERLNELIAEILALVRFDSAHTDVQLDTIDLKDMLETVVDDARFEGAEVVLNTAGIDRATAQIDPHLMHSALENIIRNALRYSSERVEVTLECNGGFKISIRDFGPGVEEIELGNLFKPFYRLEGSRNRKTGGYGLGLAIAKRAVLAHGGDISACNAEGGGLLVVVTIPQ
jgi:signal transduction histidine kinase